jgi:HK97 family phage major capsid protein
MSGEVAEVVPSQDVSALKAQIESFVGPAVQKALEPLARRQEELDEEITRLSKPRSQSGAKPSRLFGGGAPAIRQGEDPMTSRGYSFARLLQCLIPGNVQASESAKVELDLHNRLRQHYSAGYQGIIAPLGGRHLQAADARLAEECRQLVCQGVSCFDPDEFRWVAQRLRGVVRQDFSLDTDATGGILLGPVEQGEMIDLLRSKEVFTNAGAREITLPPNGRISWPRHKTAGAGYWVGEGQQITESDMTFGGFVMQAKKLGALLDLPNEMLRFVTMAIEAFIRTQIATTLALKLDSSSLSAAGSALEPKGLLNYPINSYTASTTGANGDTFEPEDVAKMVATVEEQNVDVSNFTFVMRPVMWAGVKNRRADAVTAGDKKGVFMFNTQDGRLSGYRVVTSAQVPNNVTKGSASNLTHVIGGDFSEWLIGRVGILEFALDPYAGASGGTNFRNDMTSIRAIQHVDAACRRPEAFVHCTQLING